MNNNEDLKLAAQDAVKEGKSIEQFLTTITLGYWNEAGRFYEDAQRAAGIEPTAAPRRRRYRRS